MTAPTKPNLPKWPFLLGDLLLLLLAGYICWQGSPPLGVGELGLLTIAVVLAAGLGAAPFWLEHRGDRKLAELLQIEQAVLQLKNIEGLTRQINSASAGWQVIQDEASKAVGAAQQTTEFMTREARAFQEFLAKANSDERSHLRLEVEKHRRAEHDWLLVLTGVLDHIFALHQAAVRSGQAGVVDQLDRFQNACRELTRRVGLVPYTAAPGEDFSGENHQLPEASQEPPENSLVGAVLACGYHFQGQLVRKALVTLQTEQGETAQAAVGGVSDLSPAEAGSDTVFGQSPGVDVAVSETSASSESQFEHVDEEDSARFPAEGGDITDESPGAVTGELGNDTSEVEGEGLAEDSATDIALAEPEVSADNPAPLAESESVEETKMIDGEATPSSSVEQSDGEEDMAETAEEEEEPVVETEVVITAGESDDVSISHEMDREEGAAEEAKEAEDTEPNTFGAAESDLEVDPVFGPDPFDDAPKPEGKSVAPELASDDEAGEDAITQATWPEEEGDFVDRDESDPDNPSPDDSKQGRLGFE